MTLIKVSAKLDRTDKSTPWGFRMAGGKDFGAPLIIQRVTPGSLSAQCGLQEGDTISHIGGISVASLSHKEAQDLIIGFGNSLELKLERGGSSNDYVHHSHHQPQPQQQYTSPSVVASPISIFNLTPKPFYSKTTSITTSDLKFGSHPQEEYAKDIMHPGGEMGGGDDDDDGGGCDDIQTQMIHVSDNEDIKKSCLLNNSEIINKDNSNNNNSISSHNNVSNSKNDDDDDDVKNTSGSSKLYSKQTSSSSLQSSSSSSSSSYAQSRSFMKLQNALGNEIQTEFNKNDVNADDDDDKTHGADNDEANNINSDNNNEESNMTSIKKQPPIPAAKTSMKSAATTSTITSATANITIATPSAKPQPPSSKPRITAKPQFPKQASIHDEHPSKAIQPPQKPQVTTTTTTTTTNTNNTNLHVVDTNNKNNTSRQQLKSTPSFESKKNVSLGAKMFSARRNSNSDDVKMSPTANLINVNYTNIKEENNVDVGDDNNDDVRVTTFNKGGVNDGHGKSSSFKHNFKETSSGNNEEIKIAAPRKSIKVPSHSSDNLSSKQQTTSTTITTNFVESVAPIKEVVTDPHINKDDGGGNMNNNINNRTSSSVDVINSNVDVIVENSDRKKIVLITKQQCINKHHKHEQDFGSLQQQQSQQQPHQQPQEHHIPDEIIVDQQPAKITINPRSSKRTSNNNNCSIDINIPHQLQQHDNRIGGNNNVDYNVEKDFNIVEECLKETHPGEEVVTETKRQIVIAPRGSKNVQLTFGVKLDSADGDGVGGVVVESPPSSSYGQPHQQPQHHQPQQQFGSAKSVGIWKPLVPTGERKIKVGKPGQAERRQASLGGSRVPICTSCHTSIRGPFIAALDKTWCPDHFICANPGCAAPLINCGFVEEADQLYCEVDFEKYLAPRCAKCSRAIVGEVVNALKNTYHMHCFVCVACGQPIGSGSFHNEDGKIYCTKDWGVLFQTKCYGCQFPIEPGDRWVEALSQNWHSECFNCSTCQVNLEGQTFCAKNGKPYCKKHGAARHF